MNRPNFKTEISSFQNGYTYVAGIDEVGRGCLAGPVVAAVVALDPESISSTKNRWHREVRDSKVLLPEKRFLLEPVIKQHSLGWGIGVVSPQHIDELNIHHATLLAMAKAVEDFTKGLAQTMREGMDHKLQLLIDG